MGYAILAQDLLSLEFADGYGIHGTCGYFRHPPALAQFGPLAELALLGHLLHRLLSDEAVRPYRGPSHQTRVCRDV